MQAIGWQPQRAPDRALVHYGRHRPEQSTLYRLVQQHAATFFAQAEAAAGAEFPQFVKDEFVAFLESGILAHGFLRLRCGDCGHDKLVAFSCMRRGFCPSCGARRMAQTAARLLVDHVIPNMPVRQWVVSLPLQRDAISRRHRVQPARRRTLRRKLKTPWRDDTTHLVMSPLEFAQQLAALVPRPRPHLIRFRGVPAPNAKLRALVVPQEPQAPAGPYANMGPRPTALARSDHHHCSMIFERIKTPGIAHVAYLIGNQGEAAVVDPRRDVDEYLTLARKHKLTIKYSIETHRQEDFVMGSAELARQCGAKVVNGRHKAFGHGDIRLDDREGFEIAKGIRIVALHTPGHTPESMCYAVYLDDAPDHAWAVFTGDTLFIGETGRTDLTDPSETAEHAAQLYEAVHTKLLPLGDQTIVLPAHGAGSVCGGDIAERDDSTIGLERRYNPVFVRSRQAFVQGKLDERIPRPPYFRHMEQVNSKGGMGPPLSAGAVRLLQPKDFQAESRRGVVFDLRLPEAYAGGHVPGSYSIWADGLPVFAGWVAQAGSPIYLVVDDAEKALDDAVKALGRVGLDHVEGVLAGSFEGWRDHGLPMAGVGTVEPGRVDPDAGRGDLRVLDVRDDREFETKGHIPGASHLYVGYVEHELDRLRPSFDPDAALVVTCGVGHRASLAASMLLRRGARDVRNLLGGMEAWKRLERRMDVGASEYSVTTPDVEGPRR